MINTVVINCRSCGKTFSITPEQQDNFTKYNMQLPAHCKRCFELKRQVEYVKCVECGEYFGLNGLEKHWYSKMGWPLPKRCPECRKRRREARKT